MTVEAVNTLAVAIYVIGGIISMIMTALVAGIVALYQRQTVAIDKEAECQKQLAVVRAELADVKSEQVVQASEQAMRHDANTTKLEEIERQLQSIQKVTTPKP